MRGVWWLSLAAHGGASGWSDRRSGGAGAWCCTEVGPVVDARMVPSCAPPLPRVEAGTSSASACPVRIRSFSQPPVSAPLSQAAADTGIRRSRRQRVRRGALAERRRCLDPATAMAGSAPRATEVTGRGREAARRCVAVAQAMPWNGHCCFDAKR